MRTQRTPGSWRARLEKLIRPPRVLRPTRAGWFFFMIIFAVGFAALNTGNNLLYLVLSLLLAFLVLSGFLSEWALRGIRIQRRLPREVYAGQDNPVQLEIHNRQARTSSFAIEVEDRVFSDTARHEGRWEYVEEGDVAGRVFALHIAAGERETRRYSLRPNARGHLVFAGFRVSTRFPFGLFTKSLVIEAPEEALVFPQVEPTTAGRPNSSVQHTGQARAVDVPVGASAAQLREFAEGDSMRRVAWRPSLRRGSLYVRQGEEERHAEIEVQLATGHTAEREPRGFEVSVRRAAAEVVVHLAEGTSVALRTDSDYLASGSGDRQRRQLLAFLALVQPDAVARREVRAS